MKYYFAPMEGITGYIYRNAHRKYFDQVDIYVTPFIVPTQNRKFTSREKNDFLPEHNVGLHVIPQILTNKGEDFIWAANELKQFGYEEVNLNLGCPSPTVVTKGRGAGFLGEPELLELFFDQIFSALDMKISVKTRIGKDSPEEFGRLMEIYNKYPIEELIIHPRVQKDLYKNEPNWKVMKEAVSLSKNPLCYNGNLFSVEDYKEFTMVFPSIDSIMLGRGMVANPGLAGEMKNGKKMEKGQLIAFHDEILTGYEEIISGDRNVLFKMKELWAYMIQIFDGSEKHGKKIRKTQCLADYRSVVDSLFGELDLKESAGAFGGV
ncbi:tRNA dihydrouridine synthase [Lacrimispora sp.]|uniref:tRNA dihydrouridine synthase n=1 Tax=Lacrimispora sp. TaxID=2719234 RepID=UPI00289F17FE|nr:tRNA-dihydrouridine synthase family protein [Lacrimispora sp.]